MIITSRKRTFLWQIMHMNVGTSANTAGSYENSIFGKLELFYVCKKSSS